MATFAARPRALSWRANDDIDAITTMSSTAVSSNGEAALSARMEAKRAKFEGPALSSAVLNSMTNPETDQASLGWSVPNQEPDIPKSHKLNDEVADQIKRATAEHQPFDKQLKKISKAWVTSLWKTRKTTKYMKSKEPDEIMKSEESDAMSNSKSRESDKVVVQAPILPDLSPSLDFAALIGDVILQRPKKRRSAKGICKDIMKQHEWYNKNRHTGWQASISNELTQNNNFEPISVRRMGRATDAIKWQISSAKYQSILENFQGTGNSQMLGTYRSPDSLTPFMKPAESLPKKVYSERAIPGRHEVDGGELNQPLQAISTFSSNSQPAKIWPYTFGFNNLSNSLYETQFPLSLGGVGSTLASGYSALGSSLPNKGKGRALQAIDSQYIPNIHPVIAESSGGNRSHVPSQSQGKGKTESSQHKETAAARPSGNVGSQLQDTNRSNEDPGNESHEDDDEEGSNRKRKRFRSPVRGEDKRQLPCPYHIHNPDMYGVNDRRYLTCAKSEGFEFISELVRHLRRVHKESICKNCLQKFETKRIQDDHLATCEKKNGSQEELWACIWRNRFASEPEPNLALQRPEYHTAEQASSNESGPASIPPIETTPTTFTVHPNGRTIFRNSSIDPSSLVRVMTEHFKKEMNSLDIRVGSLEKRLPLVEQATSQFQSVLRTNDKTGRDTGALRNSPTTSSRSSGGPHSEISASPGSSSGLSGKTEIAGFEEQLRMMLLTGKLRISLSNPSKRVNSGISSSEKGKQRFNLTNDNPTNPLFDEITLDGDTMCWPGSDEFTRSSDTTMSNPVAETDQWMRESSNETIPEENAPPSYDIGNHQPFFCCVHGGGCKSPNFCQRIEFSSVFQEQQENTDVGSNDIAMGNDDSILHEGGLWKDINWDELVATNGDLLARSQ